MAIDATFWVAVSFIIFFGVLIYLKIPQKISEMLDKMISDIKNEIDESEKLRTEAKTLLDNSQKKLDTAQSVSNEILENAKKDADRLTSSYLRKLAGKLAEKRGYVFYSEVKNMSGKDLETIDRLWTIYSTGRFGFSIQAKILKSVGKKYELMWPKIGWKKEGLWTRYPGSFCWSLDAPDGHMPLINQLRGVRLMDSILRHPAISKRHNNIL